MTLDTSAGKVACYTAMVQVAEAVGDPAGSWMTAARLWQTVADASAGSA